MIFFEDSITQPELNLSTELMQTLKPPVQPDNLSATPAGFIQSKKRGAHTGGSCAKVHEKRLKIGVRVRESYR